MTYSLEISVKADTDINSTLVRQLDAYVLSHPLGSIYHLSAWRVAIESVYGHKSLVLVATINGNLVGMLPLSVMTLPILGKRLVAMPFADYCEVLTDSDEISEQLLKFACSLTSDKKIKDLEIRQRRFNEAQRTLCATGLFQPATTGGCQQLKVCMQVRLPASSEQLLASYKPKLRSQIKKAEKNGLTAELSTSDSSLKSFYVIYSENMHRLGSPVHSFKWFQKLLNALPENVHYRLALVSLNDKVIGAGLVFFFGKQAWIPWASTLASYNHLAPNMLLYWHVQAFLADGGIANFDMGRSTLGEGTYRFKLQWGAEPIALNWRRFVGKEEQAVSLKPKKNARLRAIVETVWRSLPLSTATWLGAKLRGYISL